MKKEKRKRGKDEKEDSDDEDEKKSKKVGKSEEQERKEIEKWVRDMPILLTGLPANAAAAAAASQPIIGISKMTQDTIIQYSGPTLKPRKWMLERTQKFPALWSRFLQKLSNIPFFENMSIEQREEWLFEDANESELDLVEMGDGLAKGHILQIGKSSKLAELDSEKLSEWMSEMVSLQEIKDEIIQSTGKRSLFFLPNFWSIHVIRAGQIPDGFQGFQITLLHDVLVPFPASAPAKASASASATATAAAVTRRTGGGGYLVGEKLVIVDPFAKDNSPIGQDEEMIQVMTQAFLSVSDRSITHMHPSGTATIVDSLRQTHVYVKKWLNGLSPSFHKSLFQKLIRFQPLMVESPTGDVKIDADYVLLCVMTELISNPGALTPNVKRWVTGVEAFFKRLAVILPEDSFVKDAKDLVFLLGCAAISKQVSTWKPAVPIVVRAFSLGLKALKERRAMNYSTTFNYQPFKFSNKLFNNPWGTASALIDLVGSMSGDLKMYRDLANSNHGRMTNTVANTVANTVVNRRPPIMNMLHCLDQHCAAIIVYFFQFSTILNHSVSSSSTSSSPFANVLKEVFRQVTGVNPRRQSDLRLTDFGQQVVWAQRRFWAATHRHEEPFATMMAPTSVPDADEIGSLEIERVLDDAWLSAGIGVMQFKSRPPTMVTMKLTSLDDFVVIRNPSRDTKNKELLSSEQEDDARQKSIELLQKGVFWKKGYEPIPEWSGSVIKRTDDDVNDNVEYTIQLPGKKSKPMSWDLAKRIRLLIPFFNVIIVPASASAKVQTLVQSVEWFKTYSADGIQQDSGKLFMQKLQMLGQGVLKRVLTYIGNYQSSFSFPRVSRNGGAIKGGVSIDDVGAFQLLLDITRWFPSALAFQPPLSFTVKTAPLLWELADQIRQFMSTTTTTSVTSSSSSLWPPLADRMMVKGTKRIPWPHQIDIVKEFWKRRQLGYRGNMLSAPPGMGKTRVVTQYASELAARNLLPNYIIDTNPSEVMVSKLSEWLAYGAHVIILDPHINSKQRNNRDLAKYIAPSVHSVPKPFTVTLVAHDHLRDLTNVLTLSVMSQALFILDEAHKALNDTKRTQVCLELTNSAKEFICMTGTYVIDSKFDKLVPWLAQIAPIPVDRKNFWVALNSMIARRVDTGILVKRETALALLNESEFETFKKNMPPGLGGNNTIATYATVALGVAATEDACTRKMVQKCVEYLQNPDEPGVMLVAKNTQHGLSIKKMLLQTNELKQKQVLLLGTDVMAINMTASNQKEEHPHVRVVIVPIRMSTGYNLSRFRIMISMVIASNAATRAQLEGRINRIGQLSKDVLYVMVLDSTGFWASILENHEFPRRVNEVLDRALAKTVTGLVKP